MKRMSDRGYAMAALLVALSVMGIMLSVALPVWRTSVQREREAELVFRGEQYVQAIDLFSRRNGGFPPSLDILRTGRYIRKLYKDPITDGDFQPVYLGQIATAAPGAPTQAGRGAQTPATPGRLGQPPTGAAGQSGATGAGPIIGVVSKSSGEALRLYNGRGRYNEWLFVSIAATRQAGAPGGAQAPGVAGRGAQGPGIGRRGRGEGPEAPGRGVRGRGELPPGRGTPFGRPGGGFPPTPPNQRGFPPPIGPGQRGRL